MIIKPRTLLAVGLFLLTCVAYLFYVQKSTRWLASSAKLKKRLKLTNYQMEFTQNLSAFFKIASETLVR